VGGPGAPDPRGRTAGSAYIETLLVFPTLLLLITGIAQMTLIWGGELAVKHSANAAVRAAVVVLDDDPRLRTSCGPGRGR
jgi:hypothetical protein